MSVAEAPWRARLQQLGAARYHHRHPFNLLMHAGRLELAELRLWVANRYYYQTRIPIKDALIVAKSEDPQFRRAWVQRILDHDGREQHPGGIELWLQLGRALGLAREQLDAHEQLLPAVREACDGYVELVRSSDLVVAVAASLTEHFAGELMQARIEAWQRHYPQVDRDALRYFEERVDRAPQDAAFALAFVDRCASTAELAQRCLDAFARKCELLWQLLSAVYMAARLPRRPKLAARASLRHQGGGPALLLTPERALELNPSAAELLDRIDGDATLDEIARTISASHRVPQPQLELGHRDLPRPAGGATPARVLTADRRPRVRPLVLIAELTHRCPLRCGYCSNPRALTDRQHELDTATWIDTLHRAAELGVVQVHFTGGEPLVRADLDQLVSAAVDAGLYATLITSGLGAGSPTACHQRLRAAVRAGIRAVQVSLQDTDADAARTIAGRDTLARKIEFARQVRALGVSLTCNFVLHANNLERVPDFIALALELGADRVELAHTQMHGWAALNCKHLLPTRAQLEQVDALLAEAEQQCAAIIELAYVRPDLFADRPSACMGGWGQRAIVIDPAGWALPCHGARTLPLAHENVRDRSLAEIWSGPAFSAFRGQAWMEEPCRSCPARTRDFGGCRCRAFALTGRASAPDPACRDAPDHARVVSLREQTLARPLQLRTPRLRLRDQA